MSDLAKLTYDALREASWAVLFTMIIAWPELARSRSVRKAVVLLKTMAKRNRGMLCKVLEAIKRQERLIPSRDARSPGGKK